MASIYNYTFDNVSRLNDDSCYVSERQIQNTKYANNRLTNYFNDCGLQKPLNFATSQPNIFVNGGYGNSGVNGCNINEDSQMKIGSIQNREKCKISLYTRPFLTVPYLGKGPSNPVKESRLQQGEYVRNVKSCNTVTEQNFSHLTYTPLLPHVQSEINNPNNLVEEHADEGWIRGGLPTRDLIRDVNYMGNQ
jgi:hypothetical protein